MFAPVEGPAEQPFLARGARRDREGLGLGDGEDLVEVVLAEQGRPEADAAALDVVRPGAALGDHRRLAGLDHGPVDARDRAPERARDAEEAAGRADVVAEGVEPAVDLLGELDAQLVGSRRSCPCC